MTKKAEAFTGAIPVSDSKPMDPSLIEPFGAGRNAGRLLFDVGLMVSLLNENLINRPLLDFGAGTGWVSEFFVRLGIPTVSFDIHQDLESCISNRMNADERLDTSIWRFKQGDGHKMPFENETFGHICCYDTLHHMHTYPLVFEEFSGYFRLEVERSSSNLGRVTVNQRKRLHSLNLRKNLIQVGLNVM